MNARYGCSVFILGKSDPRSVVQGYDHVVILLASGRGAASSWRSRRAILVLAGSERVSTDIHSTEQTHFQNGPCCRVRTVTTCVVHSAHRSHKDAGHTGCRYHQLDRQLSRSHIGLTWGRSSWSRLIDTRSPPSGATLRGLFRLGLSKSHARLRPWLRSKLNHLGSPAIHLRHGEQTREQIRLSASRNAT